MQSNYQQPKTVADAAALLAKTGGKALAGGQSLVAAMKLRLAQPGTVVDLAGIPELTGVKTDGGALVIGAMTRHADVASSAEVKRTIPALAAVAEGIGDRQVRNMGTLGGSIANNDPAADWPAALVGLNATVVTNKRKLSAGDFFKGMYETALAADEIVTAVSFPVPKKAAYAKFPNPASRFALVGVFVAQTGRWQRARRGDRRRAVRVPRGRDRVGASEDLYGRRRESGESGRQRAQQRPARLRRVSRASRRGNGVARGGRDLAHRHTHAAVVGLPPAASGASQSRRMLSNATHM